jgi:hypothetical protein
MRLCRAFGAKPKAARAPRFVLSQPLVRDAPSATRSRSNTPQTHKLSVARRQTLDRKWMKKIEGAAQRRLLRCNVAEI